MKVVDNIIVEATEAELMEYYLQQELDLVISFKEYKEAMIEARTVINEEPHCIINGFSYSKEQFDTYSKEFGYSGF